MVTTEQLPITLGERALARLHELGFARAAMASRVARALDEAGELIDPVVCYGVFGIESAVHGRLRLAGGSTIGGGPLLGVVAGAQELVVAACTIGAALEQRAHELGAAGRPLDMMLLDELGSIAVDHLREALYEQLGAQFLSRGWRVSSPVSPGDSDWTLRDQRVIFRLLRPAQIGLSLGTGALISPVKSLTVVFGAGPGPLGAEGFVTCELCSIKDRCRHAVIREPSHAGAPDVSADDA